MAGFFSGLFGNTQSSESGYGDSSYTNDELLGYYRDLTYQECKDIYRFWPLGKRVASSLPNFAMSADREIIVKDSPSEIVDQFKKTAESLQLDKQIRKCSIYSRVFGLAAMFVACENVAVTKNLTRKDVLNNRIVFNVLDPLNIAGIRVNQDANSLQYQKVEQIQINGGQVVGSKRATAIFNDLPLYLKFSPSTFSFSGPSIYQNMTGVIKSWNRAIVALERIATKAGSIVVKSNSLAHASGIDIAATKRNLQLIRNMENDGIAALNEGGEIEFFQLNGVAEIDSIINQLNTSLMMALSDTPSAILLDKNLANGFADGSEDMKAIIMSVDNFRKLALSPLYNFADPFVMYKAWDDEFIETMKKEYPDLYRGMSNIEILTSWVQGFSFKWGNLYPEPEKDRLDTNSVKLDLLQKAKELGANDADLTEELNSMDIFDNEFDLDSSELETEGSESDSEDNEDSGDQNTDSESDSGNGKDA